MNQSIMLNSTENLLKYLNDKKVQAKIDKFAKKYNSKTILIYGAGLFFEVLNQNFDLEKLNVCAISDKKFTKTVEFFGYRAIPLEQIRMEDFDVILIAVLEPERIENFLREDILGNKIVKIEYFAAFGFKEFLKELKLIFN